MNEKTNIPGKESEINRVQNRLAMVTENCEQSLAELKIRLSGVCSKEEEGSAKPAEPEYSTILAQEINKAVSRLERLCEQMNYLRNRIEL